MMFCTRCLRASVARRQLPLARQFNTASARFYSTEPKLSTPTSEAGEAPKQAPSTPRSICPEGTVLNGLNYTKGGQDPVAMKDEDYPEWLWSCLDVMKKADAADDNMGDEFSKSKKQRRLAAKRQKTLEAKLLAEGNLEALAPKIPLQQQSVNLPGKEDGNVLDNIAAADKREELRKAMRKQRRAAIKESNYLKSM